MRRRNPAVLVVQIEGIAQFTEEVEEEQEAEDDEGARPEEYEVAVYTVRQRGTTG